MNPIVIPGRRRHINEQSAADLIGQCYSLWMEHTKLGATPMGFMRQDAYWSLLEVLLELYLRPARGGSKWDNRRKQ